MGKKKNEIKRICKNCRLFDAGKSECAVVVLHEGQRLHLPVIAEEACFFEEPYFDPTTKAVEDFADGLQEVKFWVEDKNGKKTKGNGVVKMQYPKGFIDESMFKAEKTDVDIYEYNKAMQDLKNLKDLGL